MDTDIKPWKMDNGKVTMYRLADKLDLEVISDSSGDPEKIAEDFFNTFKIIPHDSKPSEPQKPRRKPLQRTRTNPKRESRTDLICKVYQIPIYEEVVDAIEKEVGSAEFSVDEVKKVVKEKLSDTNEETIKNKAGAYIVYLRDNHRTVVTRHEGLKKFYKFEESKNSANSAE